MAKEKDSPKKPLPSPPQIPPKEPIKENGEPRPIRPTTKDKETR
jgi:hypothetical protein